MEFRALVRQGITTEKFIEICENSSSVNEAMFSLNLHRVTFQTYAKKLNCYYPKYGRGVLKEKGTNFLSKFDINKWNNDELIEVARATVRRWIFKLQLFPIKCNMCNLDKWLDKDIPLELNHINGNGHENRKSNLELLCPNCHALTETYRGKNVVLKYGKAEPQKYNKEKAKKYRENYKPTKSNKWHSYERNREQYLDELKEKRRKEREELFKIILSSNINFGIRGWRLELGKIMNWTPQYSGNFVKYYMNELWERCYRHEDRK